MWNVHSAVLSGSPRTNNYSEGSNNALNNTAASAHPSMIPRMLEILRTFNAKTDTMILHILTGKPLPPKKRKTVYVQLEKRVQKSVSFYGQITNVMFCKNLGYLNWLCKMNFVLLFEIYDETTCFRLSSCHLNYGEVQQYVTSAIIALWHTRTIAYSWSLIGLIREYVTRLVCHQGVNPSHTYRYTDSWRCSTLFCSQNWISWNQPRCPNIANTQEINALNLAANLRRGSILKNLTSSSQFDKYCCQQL